MFSMMNKLAKTGPDEAHWRPYYHISKILERTKMKIFLSISFNLIFVSQKNGLIETVLIIESVLLNTPNLCFCWKLKLLFFDYALLSGGRFCTVSYLGLDEINTVRF